jgi:hypothetical protein
MAQNGSGPIISEPAERSERVEMLSYSGSGEQPHLLDYEEVKALLKAELRCSPEIYSTKAKVSYSSIGLGRKPN